MRVTVTRPEHSGLKTAARLKALGHEPILFPLSKPVHQTALIEEALRRPFASLAITSVEALRALESCQYSPEILDKPILVVGEPSAKAARDFGFKEIHTADGFATGMIALLGDLSKTDRQALSPMLYLAGIPRGDTFESGLATLEMTFNSITAYRMDKCRYNDAQIQDFIKLGKPDGVLLFSSEAAKDYFAALERHVPLSYFNEVKFFCISGKVASELPSALSSQARVAKEPSEQGIIDLLSIISGT